MKVLCSLILLLPQILFSQDMKNFVTLYEGKIGNYPIFMQIEYNLHSNGKKDYFNCTYFYKSQHQVISLYNDDIENNTLKMWAGYEDSSSYEQFKISESPNKSWTGSWTQKKKYLAVVLNPVNANQFKHKYAYLPVVQKWKQDDPLSYMVTANLTFVQDTITTTVSKQNQIFWFREKESGISFFRLNQQYETLNKTLFDKHIAAVMSNLEGRNCDGDNERVFEIESIGQNLISFYYEKGICVFPSAAHPGLGFEYGTYDLQKQKQIDFDDMFWFSPKQAPPKEKNWNDWVKYRQEFVAPKIIQLLRKTNSYLAETPKDYYTRKDNGECYYLENEKWWSIEAWHLTKNGLVLQSFDPPRGYGPCQTEFIVPYSLLMPYINPAYKHCFKP